MDEGEMSNEWRERLKEWMKGKCGMDEWNDEKLRKL